MDRMAVKNEKDRFVTVSHESLQDVDELVRVEKTVNTPVEEGLRVLDKLDAALGSIEGRWSQDS